MVRLLKNPPVSLVMFFTIIAGILLTPDAGLLAASPEASDVIIAPSWSYKYLTGSAAYHDDDRDPESGSLFSWFINGEETSAGTAPQKFLAHFDSSFATVDGQFPPIIINAGFAEGRFGSCVYLEEGGEIAYPAAGNFNAAEGTIEMWVALRSDPSDPVYWSRPQVVFNYYVDTENSLSIKQSNESGLVHVAGYSEGVKLNASSKKGLMLYWNQDEWHYLAATFSESHGLIYFYIDGEKMGEGFYVAPVGQAPIIRIAGRCCSFQSHYYVDEVRVIDRPLTVNEIKDNFRKGAPCLNDEVYLETSELAEGDTLVFEITPSDGENYGAPVTSDSLVWPGPPLSGIEPNSMLLPPDMTDIAITCSSPLPAEARYSIGELFSFSSMTPFDTGPGLTEHSVAITGLDPLSVETTFIYFRCSLDTTFHGYRMYRHVPDYNPGFPRTFNLWGEWDDRTPENIERLSRIDLWLSADFWSKHEILQFRNHNPEILMLNSMNATTAFLCCNYDYLLKDTTGLPIENWPGRFRLNMTRTDVAESVAEVAYNRVIADDLSYDGCFFDSYYTSQSWLVEDCWGNPIEVDADEDGFPDHPDTLDKYWRAGVFHMISAFREKMPHALVSGHIITPINDDEPLDYFNGESIFFMTSDVLEHRLDFSALEERYERWDEYGVPPNVTSIESAARDEIAYGYGFDPEDYIPASTLEFVETFYPRVRFGLGVALMYDGFFAHELGDAWHGQDWWYDELDFDLGSPLGDAEIAATAGTDSTNMLPDGGFEELYIGDNWEFSVYWPSGADATIERDIEEFHDGYASCKIIVWDEGSGESKRIQLRQCDKSITEDRVYTLRFWAKSEPARSMLLWSNPPSQGSGLYGLNETVELSADWTQFSIDWVAGATAEDCCIAFLFGNTTGTVWLDDAHCYSAPPYVLTREFDNGRVYLNGSPNPNTALLDSPMERLERTQAPRHQYIIDNAETGFTCGGSCTLSEYDSGTWVALPPYYHDWESDCVTIPTGNSGSFELEIPEEDYYTLSIWWPAAPDLWMLSTDVSVRVVAGVDTLLEMTVDQSLGGDEWVEVGRIFAAPEDSARLEIEAPNKAALADAVYIRSDLRFNDGSAVSDSLYLAPYDAVILSNPAPGSDPGGGKAIQHPRKNGLRRLRAGLHR